MVKHTQTIRRLLPTNYLKVFDHFLGLVFKGLMNHCLTAIIITSEQMKGGKNVLNKL